MTPHRRSRPRDYSSAGYIEQPLRALVASKCHNFLPRRTHAASGAALKPRLESQIMHSFIKFAAVFALALLAFCGQLAALEIIVAPLVPAMEARVSHDQPPDACDPCAAN